MCQLSGPGERPRLARVPGLPSRARSSLGGTTMAYGRPATVRSHRRGGPRRRLIVAPWIVFSVVGALALAGLSVGYVYLVHGACSGQLKATIVTSPSMQPVLDGLARKWQNGEPSVKGKCAAV